MSVIEIHPGLERTRRANFLKPVRPWTNLPDWVLRPCVRMTQVTQAMRSIFSLIDGLIIGAGMTLKTCAQAEGVDTIVFRLDMRKLENYWCLPNNYFPYVHVFVNKIRCGVACQIRGIHIRVHLSCHIYKVPAVVVKLARA